MKALLIVDVQNDFLPGGALGVKNGDQVIEPINRLVCQKFDVIVASKDWHPADHGSFASVHGKQPGEHTLLNGLDQILWPDHCVQGVFGAEFSSQLDTTHFDHIFVKGTEKEIDSYSAFFDNGHLKSTGLGEYLKEKGVEEIYFAGLATDHCVKSSALDALRLGFKAYVVVDACRAVNLQENDEEKAIKEMEKEGAVIITTKDFILEES